jgi:hypothetical protein
MRRIAISAPLAAVGVAGLLAAPAAFAGELAKGQVIPRVVCRGNDRQSYALYIPSAYTPTRAWPILYCLDPGARGRLPVERFAEAAEKAGFLVAGSNNSRNGPMEPVREAIQWLLTDTHERLAIDDKRLYAAGHSGGARVALAWAQNGRMAGVAANGAGFGQAPPKQIPFALFLSAGVDDFNYTELQALSAELARRGTPHRFAGFEGGHEWLPPAVAAEALDFFLGRVPPHPAPDSREERKQRDLFERLSAELARGDDAEKTSLLKRLRHDADAASDSPSRRVARRVMGGAFIGAMEQARASMEQKDYAAAARAWETAALMRPDNPMAWYNLAVARAGAGNKRRALEALEEAVAKGFSDAGRLDAEPLLAPLRSDARYEAVVKSIRK